MRRPRASLLAFALAAAIALALASCGSGGGADLLPGTTASQINSNLDEVERLVEEGDCAGAGDAADNVSTQVDELGGVDPELKAALSEGAERLNAVVLTCEEASEETETTEAEEPEVEEKEKPAKEKKPEKSKPPKNTGPPEEAPEPPGQEEEKGNGEGPPEENEEESSGGVGPSVPAGSE